MKFKAVLSLFLSGISLPVIAQFQDNIPQVHPLSPDVAAMFKVLERPIGSYTGTVPVNFPLLSLNSGPLSASLSLDYNGTGGIRVEEVASSVGLGFSFSDGAGKIVQIINGQRDDRGGLLTSSRKPSSFNCTDMHDIWLSKSLTPLDLEPDIFMYSFNGKSGKFFFKEDGTIAISENNGIKIEYDTASVPQNGIQQWIITDEKGSKYYFGQNKSKTTAYRTVSTYQYQSVANPAVTKAGQSSITWYLSEADDMNEENALKYSYALTGGPLTTFSGGFHKSLSFGSCQGFNTSSDQAIVNTTLYDYVLTRIDGSSGYVLINAASGRQDGWGVKINNVELYDSSGVFKKRFTFNYGYFNPAGDVNTKRLKLNSFSAFESSGTDSLTYTFTYDESQHMPARLSNSVDHWGFFNNKYNTTSFPNLYYQYGSTVIRETDQANRSAVPAYAQTNILTKITYPTGGYRQFIYEGNTALMNMFNEHFMDDGYTANQFFNRTDFNIRVAPLACMKQNFTINSTDGAAVFKYLLDNVGFACSSYSTKLFQVGTPTDTVGGILLYTINNYPNYSWTLTNGYYRLEVYKSPSACTFDNLNGSWGESTLNTATIATPHGSFNRNNINAGGVRIKQINDYDPVSNKINTTEYKYKLYSTDSSFTSGLLITPLHMVSLENPGSMDGQYLAIHTSSCYPLAREGGSYVVYPEVRTIENGNGWTDRTYSYTADDMDNAFPSAPSSDNAYLRGRLLSEKYYDQSGTLIRKTTYDYISGDGGGQLAIRTKPYYYDSQDVAGEDRESPWNQQEIPWQADCRDFYYTTNSYVPYSKTDSLFSPSGKSGTKTMYNYYNYKNQLLLKKVLTSINGTDVKDVTCKYPFTPNSDFTLNLSATEQIMKTVLLGKNYLQPLEVIDSLIPTTGNGSFQRGTKYIFGSFNSSDIHLVQPRNYKTLTEYAAITLSGYDVKGNLLEQYKTSDVKEVYLWGYSKQYPVAKVVGSDYITVSGLVNPGILNAPANDAALRAELNNIRTGLAGTGAMVTTYTYNPLIGITSITDPSGKIIYYEYDGLGRLIHVRDQNNNLLKNDEYKIAGAQ